MAPPPPRIGQRPVRFAVDVAWACTVFTWPIMRFVWPVYGVWRLVCWMWYSSDPSRHEGFHFLVFFGVYSFIQWFGAYYQPVFIKR